MSGALEKKDFVIIYSACTAVWFFLLIYSYALPLSKAEAVAEETLVVWCSLASRLGLWALKAELEDLCFAVLQVCTVYIHYSCRMCILLLICISIMLPEHPPLLSFRFKV